MRTGTLGLVALALAVLAGCRTPEAEAPTVPETRLKPGSVRFEQSLRHLPTPPPAGDFRAVSADPLRAFGAFVKRPVEDAATLAWLSENIRTLPSVYLYDLARRAFLHDRDKGATWFVVGAIRARYDALRCTDKSARSGLSFLPSMAPDVAQYVQADKATAQRALARAFRWEETFPADNSPEWICRHGSKSYGAALAGKLFTDWLVPAAQWPELRREVLEKAKAWFKPAARTTDLPVQTVFERKMVLPAPPNVRRLAATPDGHLLAAAVATARGPVTIWDMRTGAVKQHLKTLNTWAVLAFTPDGRYLVTDSATRSNKGVVSVFDVETGAMVADLIPPPGAPIGPANGVAASPDGTEVAVIWWDHAGTWSTSDWSPRAHWTISTAKNVYHSLAYSPDGRVLALGDMDGGVELHDRASGRMVRRFYAHDQRVQAMTFSPDGFLITASTSTGGPSRNSYAILKKWGRTFVNPEIYPYPRGVQIEDLAVDSMSKYLITSDTEPRLYAIDSVLAFAGIFFPNTRTTSVRSLGSCFAIDQDSGVEIWCPKKRGAVDAY